MASFLFAGCRETAFVYALTSAAVAHTIARDCSQGKRSFSSFYLTSYFYHDISRRYQLADQVK